MCTVISTPIQCLFRPFQNVIIQSYFHTLIRSVHFLFSFLFLFVKLLSLLILLALKFVFFSVPKLNIPLKFDEMFDCVMVLVYNVEWFYKSLKQ